MFTNKMPKNPVPELAVAALTNATLRNYLHSNRNRFSRYLDYRRVTRWLTAITSSPKIIAVFVNKVLAQRK